MAKLITIKNHRREQKLFFRRLIVAIVIIFLLTLALVTRLVYLQISQNQRYATLSKQNQLELLPIEPNRGLIYDRNKVLLAENIPVFSLDIIPDHVTDLDKTIDDLQKIIDINDNDLTQFYKSLDQSHSFEPIPLKLKLTESEVANFYVNQYRFPGVTINARLIRYYPLKDITANIVGYVGRIDAKELSQVDPTNYSASNFIGKTGIEKQYESLLHGTVGYRQVEVDASGRMVRTLHEIKPVPGENLYLTIDSGLQEIAEQTLGDEDGAAVAIEPSTGEVLALVTHPSFDPNLFVNGISNKQFADLQNSPDQPLFNRAIRGQFPIASTIKPFLALEGLESHTITPDFRIYDPGWFKLPNSEHIYRDWNYKHGGHGYVNVSQAIIVSSDPFFYNLATLLGINRVDDILEQFGFGQLTDVDLPNELPGLVSSPNWKFIHTGKSWYRGDTVISGIGQGFMLTTPLQLADAVATIANRGLRFKPQILLDREQPSGTVLTYQPLQLAPVELENPNNWNIVIEAMEGVVNSIKPPGTGRLHFGINPAYSVAAKTGTGQVSSRSNRNEEISQSNVPKKLRDDSLFIAFAPVDNPKIAVAVIAEHSLVAGTVARKMLDYYLITEKQQHVTEASS